MSHFPANLAPPFIPICLCNSMMSPLTWIRFIKIQTCGFAERDLLLIIKVERKTGLSLQFLQPPHHAGQGRLPICLPPHWTHVLGSRRL